MFVHRDLFGGAITAQTAPGLVDASDIRQVPDTQEVFMYPDSGVSIIVEILQRVAATDPKEAIRFHFDSLAHDNSAHGSQVEAVDVINNERGDDTPSVITLKGTQDVPKFNRNVPDKVQILMGLYRVEQKGIDLVVTFNIPLESQDGAVDLTDLEHAKRDFDTFVRSLHIVDFGLFA